MASRVRGGGGGGDGEARHTPDLLSPVSMSGEDSSSPGSSLAPLLPPPLEPGHAPPAPPPRRLPRLRRSASCHQFDARGALLQWGAGLGACFPMELGPGLGPRPQLPKFTDEEVFLANHPGANYTTASKRK